MSDILRLQRDAFRATAETRVRDARQTAAFFLMTGLDLAEALSAPRSGRQALLARLDRLIERERLKGVRRHWSYDLNRHIALKQARDRIAGIDADGKAATKKAPSPNGEGALLK